MPGLKSILSAPPRRLKAAVNAAEYSINHFKYSLMARPACRNAKPVPKLQIDTLHANIEVGVNELQRDAQVQQMLEQQQIRSSCMMIAACFH